MYMAPITRACPVASPLKRRLLGVAVLIPSVVVMVPWLADNAALSIAVLGTVALGRGPHALMRAIDDAGAIVLGR